MIVVTGAAGFIGSVIVGYLNKLGIQDIFLFDDLASDKRFKNLIGKSYFSLHLQNERILDWSQIDAVIHFGANTNTLETDWKTIYHTNVQSTRYWHEECRQSETPFIFASSAAVYGNGYGPENHYAFSKLESEQEISDGVILRLFNVYGPNESHKRRMASTVYHWYNQLKDKGEIEIFENSDQYLRDFIYVEDIARIVAHFLNNYKPGIYDVGTGKATSFETVADTLIKHYGSGKKKYIPMPEDLQAQYQKFTQAEAGFLKDSGFDIESLAGIDAGIETYLTYLKTNSFY